MDEFSLCPRDLWNMNMHPGKTEDDGELVGCGDEESDIILEQGSDSVMEPLPVCLISRSWTRSGDWRG